jgi:DNA-binding CsgD family transcriptional regulator
VSESAINTPRDVTLTPIQHEIVERLKAGDNASTIARSRKRSVDTVRRTIRTIYERYGVRTRTELLSGIKTGSFIVSVRTRSEGDYDLRSGLTAIDRALRTMRIENAVKRTRRRRASVRLHEAEMSAILAACAKIAESP